MAVKRLHHVGIIMPTLEKAQLIMRLLGLETDFAGYVPEYQADCIFTKHGNGSPVEFIVPKGGVLSEYNNGRGGLHHLAYEVDDVRRVRDELAAKGIELLEKTPVKGAGDFLVNFMRPRDGGGILVEFVQPI